MGDTNGEKELARSQRPQWVSSLIEEGVFHLQFGVYDPEPGSRSCLVLSWLRCHPSSFSDDGTILPRMDGEMDGWMSDRGTKSQGALESARVPFSKEGFEIAAELFQFVL